MKSTFKCTGSSVVMLILALGATAALAGKPGPSLLPGTVYAERGTIAMNANGGDRVAMPAGVAGNPSTLLHGGYRWFLTGREMVGETNCDGTRVMQLFAVREDGDDRYTVQLTNSTTGLELSPGPLGWDTGAEADWKASDTELSFRGMQVAPDTCEPIEAGIYVAPIEWGPDGNLVGLAETPTLVFALPAVRSGPDNRWGPAGTMASWSPDGTQFAYSDGLGVRVATLATQQSPASDVVIVPGGYWVQWSPAGDRLAYTRDMQVETCDPSGGNVLRHPWDRQRRVRTEEPFWNPAGTHLVMRRITKDRTGWITDVDIYRTTAAFTEGYNLTGDTTDGLSPRKWVP